MFFAAAASESKYPRNFRDDIPKYPRRFREFVVSFAAAMESKCPRNFRGHSSKV